MRLWYGMYMTYVSPKPLSNKILKRIGDLLVAEIARAKTSPQARTFIEALLTDSEYIMLAKRFAIVVLLSEGASYRYIQNILKVSLATVFRIQQLRKKGVFEDFVACTYRREKRREKSRRRSNDTKETAFEVFVRGGLPPMGKGRWRFLYKQTDHIVKRKHSK